MKVILHADDFGYDKDTTEATIELLEGGYLTSASIMANMPYTKEACEYAAKHPEKSFGVHLTYVDNLRPCSNSKDIPSLVNEDGVFLMANEILKRSMLLRLNTDQIVQEAIAQIDVLRNAGVKVSHLDSHGHYHKFPSFQIALKSISKKTNITKFRRIQNIFINEPHFGPKSILNWCFEKGITTRFISTNYFYMNATNLDTQWSETIIGLMDKLPQDATIEIGVHPGKNCKGVEAYRNAEYNDMCRFATMVSNYHDIINWNQI